MLPIPQPYHKANIRSCQQKYETDTTFLIKAPLLQMGGDYSLIYYV